mmetsp:Transcript_6174/g.6373  ORF Transcript_6174/g.6373 Transcript_6174/m.6373 type:complete len:144 (+) Transcript_6174:71-502(+)|eukprot:CAMPEP_0182428230 /NCGR_PEP_ID=MMETSP1167-20130531/21657_1 /TAXON_ID=2988 /ORGANISM="Mallomonas Sp, Strain CCMP3275" /LENGTH=143 /DNA_ID=CAMNT_0024610983 /DNA_START=70 /DNA_END=501 /DNA_ORIENTATION=+
MIRAIVFVVIVAVASAFAPMSRMVRSKVEMNMGKEFVAAAIASSMILSPMAVMAADIENGGAVFGGNCAACHAGGNNVVQTEKTLRKEALDQYLTGGLSEKSIITQVTNGKNAMPAFGDRLDPEDIADVAAYVYDQATGAKWD